MRSASHMTVIMLIGFLVIGFSARGQDYSAYRIAKSNYNEHNYLLAYKYLIIFKFTNIDRLNKPDNGATLKALDKEIGDLENLLSQNMNWYSIKSARGWSDKSLADSLKNAYSGLKLPEIKIE